MGEVEDVPSNFVLPTLSQLLFIFMQKLCQIVGSATDGDAWDLTHH